jgi:epoxyqueuosine reductase
VTPDARIGLLHGWPRFYTGRGRQAILKAGDTAKTGTRARMGAQKDTRESLNAALRARAAALGFDACRVAAPEVIVRAPVRLAAWLADGMQGEMGWMAETAARRADPRALWPGVRSVVMVGMNYGPQENPLDALARKSSGAISVYARHRDYHDVMKGRLKTLAQWLIGRAGGDARVFVDTAPVMEKPLAAGAGVGWQGKHSNLVSREFGSWLFLGALFTSLDLECDGAARDSCGSCRACLDICPTQAFPRPYVVDARRCISYLTIEHKGPIPREFRAAMGNRIYGCDDCLAVCPWNKFAQAAREAKLRQRDDLAAPALAMLAGLDDAGFRALFSGSPVKRVGRDRFLRNVMIACGNSGDSALIAAAVARLRDASPLVRGAAVWALSRLADRATVLREAAAAREEDAAVRDEWRAARAEIAT